MLLLLAFHSRVVFSPSDLPFLLLRVFDLSWAGVDLFFVLSGFLITGILLDSRESATYFRTFYLRRAVRIFPLALVYLFLILVVARYTYLWFGGTDLWPSTNPTWYLTYLANWKSDHGVNDLAVGHFWSLAIEEQFYFVWPLVVWLCPPKRLGWVCGMLAAVALGARWLMGEQGIVSEAAYRLTFTRMDTLAFAASIAVGVRHFRDALNHWVPIVWPLAAFAFLTVAVRMHASFWGDPLLRTAGVTLIGLLWAGVVFRAATSSEGYVHRFFSSSVLRRCGKYSYGMYVLHSIPYNLTAPWAAAQTVPVKYLYFPVLTLTAYALAWISWRVLEEPFLRLKRGLEYAAPAADCAVVGASSGTGFPRRA